MPLLIDISMCAVPGAEQSEDGREIPRSPTLINSGVAGSSHAERSSTSSDSAVAGICSNTDHTVNDRHSSDEVASRVSLPKGINCMHECLHCGAMHHVTALLFFHPSITFIHCLNR